MAFPRNSLRAFLQYAKRNLAQAANGDQKVNIVIGNESAGPRPRLFTEAYDLENAKSVQISIP